jgi:hypothetical protein
LLAAVGPCLDGDEFAVRRLDPLHLLAEKGEDFVGVFKAVVELHFPILLVYSALIIPRFYFSSINK